MPEYNPAVALDYKSPSTPDVIGTISTLAQLQYMQAHAAQAQAETGLVGLNTQYQQNRLASLSTMQNMMQSGKDLASSAIDSGYAAQDPTGFSNLLTAQQTGMDLSARRAYAASGGVGGAPGSISRVTPGGTQESGFNGGGLDPNAAALGGPGMVGAAATAQDTMLKNAAAHRGLFGQLGNMMVSDPSPQGRAQATQFASLIPLAPGESPQSRQQMIQQLQTMPDPNYTSMGQRWQQGSMPTKDLSTLSGQEAFNQGAVKAATENVPLNPGQTLNEAPAVRALREGVQPPPVAGFGVPGNLTPTTGSPAAPGLGNYAPPSSIQLPSGPQPGPQPSSLGAPLAVPSPGEISSNSPASTQLFGRLGAMMTADPTPQGRAQAAQFAASIPLAQGETPQSRQQMIQQFVAAPPDQYVAAGQHFLQASMTPERYQTSPGAAPSQGGFVPGGPGNTPQPSLPSPVPSNAPAQRASPGALPSSTALSLFTAAAVRNGLPTSDGATLMRYGQLESGLNPNKVNAGSGAAGILGFVPSTWKQYGKGSPFDPVASANAGALKLVDDRSMLTQTLGRPPTPAELYLAHQQGPTGATKLLENPNIPAGQLLPMRTINGKQIDPIATNGGNPNAPASAFINMWTGRFNVPGMPGSSIVPGTTVTPAGGAAMTMPPQATPQQSANPPTLSSPYGELGTGVPVTPASSAPPRPTQPPQTPIASSSPTAPLPVAALPAPSAQPLATAAGATPPPTGTAADQTHSLYQNPTQGMSIAEKAAQEASGKGWGDQITEITKNAQTSKAAQVQLGELQHYISQLPSSGLLTPGTGAVERIALAKEINTGLAVVGMAHHYPPEQIAAAEAAQKITGTLGTASSRLLGSREAAQIVQQQIGLQPNVAMTQLGNPKVAAAVNVAFQRGVDYRNFLAENDNKQYISRPDGTKEAADVAFNRINPVLKYVQDGQKLAEIPQDHIDRLQKYSEDPRAAAAFDKQYGAGLSRYYVGQ